MSRLTILDEISIASPCEADWAEIAGDHRVRFCSTCSKHVYNIMAMTAEEASTLILESEGKLCARIYRRSDGTVLTADCPVGRGRVSKRRRLRRELALGLVVPGLMVTGVAAMGFGSRRADPFPSGPGVTWDDRIDWALVTLGLRSRPQVTAGKICLPPQLVPAPAPNGTTPVFPTSADLETLSATPLPMPTPTPPRPPNGGQMVLPVSPADPTTVAP
jgi:hypothetical protein